MPQKPNQIIKVEVSQIVEKVDTALVKSIDLNKAGLLKQMNCQLVQAQKDSDVANVLLKKCNGGIKAIKALCLEMTKPLRDETKRINAEFDTVLAPMKTTHKELDDRVLSWRLEQDRKHAEAQRKADEAQRAAEEVARKKEETNRRISLAKGGNGDVKPVEVEKVEQPPVNQMAIRDTTNLYTRYKVNVTDITKIPPEYFDNEEVINAVRKQLQKELDLFKERTGKFFSPEDFKIPGAEVEKIVRRRD